MKFLRWFLIFGFFLNLGGCHDPATEPGAGDILKSADAATTATITYPPAAPTNLISTLTSDNRVSLTWNDNSVREEAYVIYRMTVGGAFAEIARTPANSTTYLDLSNVPGTSYKYEVKAYQASTGYSNPTNIAYISVPAYKNVILHAQASGFQDADLVTGMLPFAFHATGLIDDPLLHTAQLKSCVGLPTEASCVANIISGIEVANENAVGAKSIHLLNFDWNFGDPGSSYNELRGFNAGHLFSNPGSYKVTLTISDASGKVVSVGTRSVVVSADTRKQYYVSTSGLDTNPGTQLLPFKTISKAISMGSNSSILLKRGSKFVLTSTLPLGAASNLDIGAYGSGNPPLLFWNVATTTNGFLFTSNNAKNITIHDLALDCITQEPSTVPGRVLLAHPAGGVNFSVYRNKLYSTGGIVNGEADPHGVLVQDNETMNDYGTYGDGIWVEGSDWVIIGNVIRNVWAQNFRSGGISADGTPQSARITLAYNKLSNIDRRPIPTGGCDPKNTPAPCDRTNFDYINDDIRLHTHFGMAYKNVLNSGHLVLGTLGGYPTKPHNANERGRWIVAEGNILNGESLIKIEHGGEHMRVEGNSVTGASIPISVNAYNVAYKRGPVDIHILRNVIRNTRSDGHGTGIWVGGAVSADGSAQLTMVGNQYIAPNLIPGSWGQSSPVLVTDISLRGFKLIDQNIWPLPLKNQSATKGINSVNGVYLTPDQWNAIPQVGTDTFKN